MHSFSPFNSLGRIEFQASTLTTLFPKILGINTHRVGFGGSLLDITFLQYMFLDQILGDQQYEIKGKIDLVDLKPFG